MRKKIYNKCLQSFLVNFSPVGVDCWLHLQTVWTQIRPDRMCWPDLDQNICHSDNGIPERIFRKNAFCKKKQQIAIILKKLPILQQLIHSPLDKSFALWKIQSLSYGIPRQFFPQILQLHFEKLLIMGEKMLLRLQFSICCRIFCALQVCLDVYIFCT